MSYSKRDLFHRQMHLMANQFVLKEDYSGFKSSLGLVCSWVRSLCCFHAVSEIMMYCSNKIKRKIKRRKPQPTSSQVNTSVNIFFQFWSLLVQNLVRLLNTVK